MGRVPAFCRDSFTGPQVNLKTSDSIHCTHGVIVSFSLLEKHPTKSSLLEERVYFRLTESRGITINITRSWLTFIDAYHRDTTNTSTTKLPELKVFSSHPIGLAYKTYHQ